MQRVFCQELLDVRGGIEHVLGVWHDIDRPLCIDDVLQYNGSIPDTMPPFDPNSDVDYGEQARLMHVQRIRYCMLNPSAWPPLEIESDMAWGTVMLNDGHHRLAAAHLLELETVPVVWSGIWKDIRASLPRSYRAGLLRLAFD